MKKIVLAAMIAAVSATPAFAATTDTEAGAASAEVVAPIVLTHTPAAVLNFGKFTAEAGTITVDSAGARTASGPGLVDTASSADAFTVTGDPSRVFDISTASGTGGTLGTMTFTTSASAATGTLSAGGTASFTVGGILTVAGGETAGVYTGTYDATVTYQ
jgi:hypothetical protein